MGNSNTTKNVQAKIKSPRAVESSLTRSSFPQRIMLNDEGGNYGLTSSFFFQMPLAVYYLIRHYCTHKDYRAFMNTCCYFLKEKVKKNTIFYPLSCASSYYYLYNQIFRDRLLREILVPNLQLSLRFECSVSSSYGISDGFFLFPHLASTTISETEVPSLPTLLPSTSAYSLFLRSLTVDMMLSPVISSSSLFSNLLELSLTKCYHISSFSSFFSSSPLTFPSSSSIPIIFQRCEKLVLDTFPLLSVFPTEAIFPKLLTLKVSRCSIIESIPLFSSLTHLSVRMCHCLRRIASMSSLIEIHIDDCFKVDNLNEFLSHQTTVSLSNYHVKLPDSVAFRNIIFLSFYKCKSLLDIVGLSSIPFLKIRQCEKLEIIPVEFLYKIVSMTKHSPRSVTPTGNSKILSRGENETAITEEENSKSDPMDVFLEVDDILLRQYNYQISQHKSFKLDSFELYLPLILYKYCTTLCLKYCRLVSDNLHSLLNIVSLELVTCPSITTVPSFPKLFRLAIYNCQSIKAFGETYPVLETVIIDHCPKVSDISMFKDVSCVILYQCQGIKDIHHLGMKANQTVSINECNNISRFSSFMSCYRLTFSDCSQIQGSYSRNDQTRAIQDQNESHEEENDESIHVHTVLIENCPELTSLRCFQFVYSITLTRCEGICNLAGLTFVPYVKIVSCSGLVDISALGVNKQVWLIRCPVVEDVSSLSTVPHVIIHYCPNVKEVQCLAGKVKKLQVRDYTSYIAILPYNL
jgi:hypothetical protein